MNVVMSLTEMEMSSDVQPLVSEEGIICVVLLHKIDSERSLQDTQVNTLVIYRVVCVVLPLATCVYTVRTVCTVHLYLCTGRVSNNVCVVYIIL